MSSMEIERIGTGSRLSKGVKANGWVFLSGLTATDPKAGVTEQTRSVLSQVDTYLAELGSSKEHIVSAIIWLSHLADASEMNAVWEEWLLPFPAPARATVEARFVNPDVRVEIMVQAVA